MSETDPIIHLKCTRTGRVYRIVAFDSDKKLVTLRGKNGTFVEPFRPAQFREMGYERIVGAFDGMIEHAEP